MNVPFALGSRSRLKSIAAINNDIDEELKFHIQCRIDELIADDVSVVAAEKKARMEFGSSDRIRKQCQHINYGSRIWVGRLAICGLLLSVIAIGWLSYELLALKSQNAELAHKLSATIGLPTVPAMIPLVAPQQKEDLTGVVTGPDGKPVADAKVLLFFKFFPGGQFRFEMKSATTDDMGKFGFKNLYSTDMDTQFIVTVLKQGHTMVSESILNRGENRVVLEPLEFQTQKAIPKTIVLLTSSGDPLANARVFAKSRKPSDDDAHFVFPMTGKSIATKTDSEGKIKMEFFAIDDDVELRVVKANDELIPISLTIDKSKEQSIEVAEIGAAAKTPAATTNGAKVVKTVVKSDSRKKANLVGKVVDENGKPISGGEVLMVQKSWPNDRYSVDSYKTKTDDEGNFVFPNRYRVSDPHEFNIAVIADGWAMDSVYVEREAGEKIVSVEFELKSSVKKTFVFKDANGKNLKGISVFPNSRTHNGQQLNICSHAFLDPNSRTSYGKKLTLKPTVMAKRN